MIEALKIRLNGKNYTSSNLDDLLRDVNSDGETEWLEAIYRFLRQWFDPCKEIEALTSGSTGVPKTIMLSKDAMVNSARLTCEFFHLHEESRALLCLPASYIAGKMMLVRAMVAGFDLHVIRPVSCPFDKLVDSIDFVAVTPMQMAHSFESVGRHKVKKIIIGGGRVTGQLEKLISDWPGEIYETYGMTETCSHIALRKVNGNDRSSGFKILGGINVRQDQRGCLVINAPSLSPQEIVTNDMVEFIGNNSFRWLGRFDHVINTGGIKVFPESIEKKLETLITGRFFIAAIPDTALGEKVVLVLESPEITTIEQMGIFEKAGKLLSRFEMPKKIFCVDKFIESDTGKIRRKEILQNLHNISS